jgi:hypothetical protein
VVVVVVVIVAVASLDYTLNCISSYFICVTRNDHSYSQYKLSSWSMFCEHRSPYYSIQQLQRHCLTWRLTPGISCEPRESSPEGKERCCLAGGATGPPRKLVHNCSDLSTKMRRCAILQRPHLLPGYLSNGFQRQRRFYYYCKSNSVGDYRAVRC